ncbi:hypothetical protein E4T16_14790 [Vibrio parahaemolyticus]|nr:hypothetical protein [Vibrio parahaemolyticus]EGR0686870.1 hypothetical protein [Vibrio parahaemolyticus]
MSEKVLLGTLLVAGFLLAVRWAFKSDTSSFDEALDRFLSSEQRKEKKGNSNPSSAYERRRKAMFSGTDSMGCYQKHKKANERLHRKR